jgi:hypothetical protein
MALQLIKEVPNCFPYTLWDGVPAAYNAYLVAPPRIYQEEIGGISLFYYDPARDRLCVWAVLNTYHWPGWAVRRYDFDAETGAFLGSTGENIGPIAWVAYASLGSYGSIYTTWRSEFAIKEVNLDNMSHDAGMWSIDPATWSPPTIFSKAIVNREDGLIVGVLDWNLEIWDISGAPVKQGSLRLPSTLGYLAYESRQIGWVITANGLVGKFNYFMNPPRWEILSSVQNPEPTTKGYYVAFDTKRNRLAVLRWLPDAVDGACQSRLEFYRPLYLVAGLTDPVPVTKLRTGEKVRFVAHLYGSSGEGVSTYPVRGALTEPAAGALLTPITMAVQSGAATLRYQAPEAAATETLALSATVEA